MRSTIRLFLSLVAAVAVVSPTVAVTNGALDGGTHPSVGFVLGTTPGGDICSPFSQAIGCSGVLIGPDIFLTSGYCGDSFAEALATNFIDRAWVIIDANPLSATSPATLDCTKFIGVTAIHVNPAFVSDPFTGNVSVLVLDTPQSGIAPAALPPADSLKKIGGKKPQFTVVSTGGLELPGGGTDIGTLARRFTTGNNARVHVVNPEFHVVDLDPGTNPMPACVLSLNEGGGTFVRDSNQLISLVLAGSDCVTQGRFQRLDVPSVRDFLSGFVTVP